MLKDLEAVLAAAAIAAAPLAMGACDGGDDGETESVTDAGCPGSTGGCPGTTTGCPGTSAGCPGTSAGCPATEPPTNADDLLAWLEAESYSGWASESAVHASSGPHGNVKIFINQTLDDSLGAANAEHPMGAAAVKELYDADSTTRIGWSVEIKTAADSNMGMNWYWFDYKNDALNMEGMGLGTCTGCHASGADYVTVTYPLQ